MHKKELHEAVKAMLAEMQKQQAEAIKKAVESERIWSLSKYVEELR